MEHIFLDTSIFEKNNFLEGQRIKSIFKLSKENHIKVVMPQLTYSEILNRISKNTKTSLDKIKNEYFLKNYEPIRSIEELWKQNAEDHIIESIQKNLEFEFENSNFEMIDYSSNPNIIKEVFDDYFEGKPPFSNVKKKSEFPDAFTLKILEEYAVKNNIEISVFSADKDYSDFQSKCLKIQNADDFGKFINDKIEKL